ncbi:MAG: penicillin acylase family protein [Pyrinomonadaceae bacterium]
MAQTPMAAGASAREQTLSVAGLRARVTIRRDDRGVPHIEAANDADLFFAQGYVTAQDRLWQMDLLRRTARGELAEIFGQLVLEEDKRRRAYGFARVAQGALDTLPTETRAALEAYARGVNAYVATLDDSPGNQLPVEFRLLQYKPRPWIPLDSLTLIKNFSEALSTTWTADLMRAALADLPAEKRQMLLPETSPLDVIVFGSDRPAPLKAAPKRNAPARAALSAHLTASEEARAEIFAEVARAVESNERTRAMLGFAAGPGLEASNNWVVGGKHTVSGKPLLANDPHLAPSAPPIWHMAHLKAPGINVAGVAAPGTPGIVIGHNEHIVWGLTNLGPDVQDLYLEKFSADGKTYQTPSGPRLAEVRVEEIKVRKGPTDPATDTVRHEVTLTRHGPIILARGGARYSLRWTALDPQFNELLAFHKLNRARDWDEFRGALKEWGGATQNFVYADVKGNIGYYGAGKIPVRKTGDGSTPYDGSTDAGEWTGFIPFDKLPHVFNPPEGMIVTANSRVVGVDYPFHLTHEWASPYRSRRIYELLKATPKHSADTFRRIQGDTYTIGGVAFSQAVLDVGRSLKTAPGPEQAELFDQFQNSLKQFAAWDGKLSADTPVGPLLAEMQVALRPRILNAAVGADRAAQYRWASGDLFINRLVTERPAAWLPAEFKDYGELLLACYKDAREALTKRIGADEAQWTWGRYAQSRFPHPLASVPIVGQQFVIQPFPQNGAGGRPGATVNVGSGVSMRLIADPSDWDRTQQGIALGVSGDPKSPHWNDQLADWRAATPRALPFSQPAVASATRATLVLTPAGQ